MNSTGHVLVESRFATASTSDIVIGSSTSTARAFELEPTTHPGLVRAFRTLAS